MPVEYWVVISLSKIKILYMAAILYLICHWVNIFMATGRSTQLTRQIGEHLIVAKLGRLGYIATPFAGNVPDFDLLIADDNGHSIPVQVKAINGGSWQFNISKFLEVEIIDGVQYVRDLQIYFSKSYKGGRRKRNQQSLHCAIRPKDLEQFRNN